MPSRSPSSKTAAELRVLRLPEVRRHTGLSRSEIYRRMAAGDFPKPVPLTTRTVGWLDHEVQAWLSARVVDRDRR